MPDPERDSSDRWTRIDELFHGALELPGEQRAAFLDKTCGDDRELRREIQQLVSAADNSQAFVEGGALGGDFSMPSPESLADEDSWQAEGQRIGPYRLVRQIGSGGMGTVWLADRADDAFEQRVAIKLIKRGMDTDDILRRFRQERQVLAHLDHPNIARLHDGGATLDGRPYLVMEYVEGVSMLEYADGKGLSLESRLRLFCKVCAAVQSAHQNLVVHRDLKPSNILVNSEGEPKLLDFGIAKLLDPESVPGSETTTPGRRLLTPRYASPEHLAGQAVATTSDVYSLGVILYELLTGLHPFDVDTNSVEELQRVVTAQEPTRPSSAVLRTRHSTSARNSKRFTNRASAGATSRKEASRLSRGLAGDLDNIVLMALRKEPARRYSTVASLSDDVRRYLERLPVAARADTFGYQFGKFVHRNRAMVGGVAVLFVALLGASIVSTGMYFRADAARQAAEQAENEAESQRARANRVVVRQQAVKLFLTEVLGDLNTGDDASPPPSVLEALDQQVAGLAEARRPLDSDIEAAVRTAAGELYRWLGEPEVAVEEFETALTLCEAAGTDTRQLADVLGFLGQLLPELDRADEAAEYLTRAIEVHDQIGTPARNVAMVRLRLGEALLSAGRLDEADEQLAEVGPLVSSFYRELAEDARADIRRQRAASRP